LSFSDVFWKDSVMVRFIAITACVAALVAPVTAQTSKEQDMRATAPPANQAVAPMSEGEVRKVDKDGGKLTIKHGPLANLDMPGMTMVFRVKDPAMLNQVKEGDKIKFVADRVNGAITVIQLEVAR
jgi:Cu(I)/Ag(I) efflux system periplasmic protein CusF